MDVFGLLSRFEGIVMVCVETQVNGLNCFESKDVVSKEVNIYVIVNILFLQDCPLV